MCFSELQSQFDLKAKLTSLLMKSDLRALALWKALPWGCGAEPGGTTKAPRRGWEAHGCQDGAVPSPPNQTHSTDPSKVSWARLGVVLGVSHSLAIPRHCGAHQEGIPWKGMELGRDEDGVRTVICSAGPRTRQGQACSILSAYRKSSHY